MNWQRIYTVIRTTLILGGSMGAGTLWAALGAGLARWLFGLDENTALLWVGLPIFVAFIPFCIFILPKHLRKAGIL